MHVGQQVVCINDSFAPIIHRIYTALPKKDVTYTIRAVYVGRSRLLNPQPGETDGEIGLLLQELTNPPDPKNRHHNELGFSSERFTPLDTLPDEADEQKEDKELAVALQGAGTFEVPEQVKGSHLEGAHSESVHLSIQI